MHNVQWPINSITHRSWHGLVEIGFGRIVNMSSAHGTVASPNKSAYVTAKHGIIGLTKVHNEYTIKSILYCYMYMYIVLQHAEM